MNRAASSSKIIWAVEPYSTDESHLRALAETLRDWTHGTRTLIEPVSVLEPEPLTLAPNLLLEIDREIRAGVKERVDRSLARLGLPHLLPLTLLQAEHLSVRHAVHRLVDFAKRSGADFIAVSAHSRKTVTRFFFGSFAETLALQTEIPVLVINPHPETRGHLNHILYPTDLSPESREGLGEVIALAKARKATITLMHKVEYITAYTAVSQRDIPGFFDLVAKDVERRRGEAEAMVGEIRSQGVEAKLVFCDRPGEIVEAIVEAALKNEIGLIAVLSQTGPIASAILGSVTRKVLREAPCPVWVLHRPQTPLARTEKVSV